MTVMATAVKTLGLGCINGDRHTYKHVARVEDCGTYFAIVFHENRKVRCNKEAWSLEVLK